jgi:hypothetical protein
LLINFNGYFSQPKPIWLSNGTEDSAPSNNGRSLEPDDSPQTTRKARPLSRHSRDLLEKDKERAEKEKPKDGEMGIFGPSKMVKSPSFGREANASIFSSPNTNQNAIANPNPTPRRTRLADSSSSNPAANNSNVLYSNLSSSPVTDNSKTQPKKRVNALDIGESSTDCIFILFFLLRFFLSELSFLLH